MKVACPVWEGLQQDRLVRTKYGVLILLHQLAVPLAVLLALTTPTWASSVRCTIYEEKTMQHWQTVCNDGSRATSTWSPSLRAWQTTITPAPGQTCTGRLNPTTRSWEGRCR